MMHIFRSISERSRRIYLFGLFIFLILIFRPLMGALTVSSHSFSALSPDGQSSNGKTIIVRINYNVLNVEEQSGGDIVETVQEMLQEAAAEEKLVGRPYNYPNPFRLREGSVLAYRLGADIDVELYVYNSRGHRVAHQYYAANDQQSDGTYKKININRELFGGFDLSAGIYYYILSHEGKVLGKGKMAIIP